MKKIKKISLLLILLFSLTGCGKKSNLDNATIYTTIYPVTYITNYLYGDKSTIQSIYPSGVDIDKYELTDKQIDNYSKGDLFAYVGLSKENDIAKKLYKKNRHLLLINVSYSLPSIDNLEELWLSPKSFLILLKNTKNSLNEYLNNSYKEEDVNKKYDELYNKVSWLDAELRSLGKTAKENGKSTIIVYNNSLNYLSDYGFNIISIEDILNSNSENAKVDLQNKFKSTQYKSILKLNSEKNNDFVTNLVNQYKANVLSINDLVSNEDSAADYLTIQYENIATIRSIVE